MLAGEAVGHEVKHGDMDHGSGAVGACLVVAYQAAAQHQPAKGALGRSAASQRGSGGGSRMTTLRSMPSAAAPLREWCERRCRPGPW